MSDADPYAGLYDEDPAASMPIREEQWRQIEAYIQRLTEAAENRGLYPADFSSTEAYLRTIEPLRQLLRDRIGYPPPGLFDTVEARLEQVGEDAVATYFRCWVPIADGLEAYGLYIVPKGLAGPAPLAIAKHGGGGTPEAATFGNRGNYHDMVRGSVAEGFVTFVPHTIHNPYTDKDHDSPLPPSVRRIVDQRLRLLGTSITALEVAKIVRSLDVLLKRPEVDPERVCMFGLSYGGYYTEYTTALEPRIKCAISACIFRHDPDRVEKCDGATWFGALFHGTATDLGNPELVALICPRPLMVKMGINDSVVPIEGARKAAVRSAQYYAKLGIPERFEFVEFDGAHEFRAPIAWQFLRKWL